MGIERIACTNSASLPATQAVHFNVLFLSNWRRCIFFIDASVGFSLVLLSFLLPLPISSVILLVISTVFASSLLSRLMSPLLLPSQRTPGLESSLLLGDFLLEKGVHLTSLILQTTNTAEVVVSMVVFPPFCSTCSSDCILRNACKNSLLGMGAPNLLRMWLHNWQTGSVNGARGRKRSGEMHQ